MGSYAPLNVKLDNVELKQIVNEERKCGRYFWLNSSLTLKKTY